MDNKCSLLYKQLAEQILIEKYALKRLDERFSEEKNIFTPDTEEKSNGLKYFTMINNAYVERLSEEDLSAFKDFVGNPENEKLGELLKIVAATYHIVLGNCIREEFFLSMNGGGNYPLNSTVIFEFADKREFDENGNYIQPSEEKKNRVFFNVKKQYEKMVFDKTGDNVCIVRAY